MSVAAEVAEQVEADEPSLIDEAVQKVWERVASKQAKTVAEAVRDLWPLDLDEDALNEAARQGLITIAHDRQQSARRAQLQPIGWGSPHGKQWVEYMTTFAQPFEDAEGREKPLIDFDLADLAAFQARCRTTAKGWLDRGRIAKKTADALVKHGADRIRQLPEGVLAQLATEWNEVWS